MSQATVLNNGSLPQQSTNDKWLIAMIQPQTSFDLEIANKLSPFPHYPGPIRAIGGLYHGPNCRIPGFQPLIQPILRPKTHVPNCLTSHCYEYGNTRFPPMCECGDKYDCRSYNNSCVVAGNCSPTCGTCNHNSNVIFH